MESVQQGWLRTMALRMVSGAPPEDESREERKVRWRREIDRELWRWRHFDDCPLCGERVGHWGGSVERSPCELIPLNIPLEEVRPNCLVVRRYWIGDAIRAACRKDS